MSKNAFYILLTIVLVTFSYLMFKLNDSEDFSEHTQGDFPKSQSKNSADHSSQQLSSTDKDLKSSLEKRRIKMDRHSSGLSLAEIEEIGAKLKNEKDPQVLQEFFKKLISGMTAENALDIRRQIVHLPEDNEAFMEFHLAYGAVAREEAVIHGAKSPERDMALSLTGWATSDPQSALDWFKNLDVERKRGSMSQEYLAEGILRGMAEADPAVATDFLLNFSAKDSSMKNLAEILATKVWDEGKQAADTDAAKAWLADLPEGKLRTYAQGQIALNLAKENPQAAAQWAVEVLGDSKDSSHVYERISKGWAAQDPVAAVNWLSSLEQSDTLNDSYFEAYSSFAEKDVGQAFKSLTIMPESENRNSAISGFAAHLAVKDPVNALSVLESITDPEQRQKSLIQISQRAFPKDTKGLYKWLEKTKLSKDAKRKIIKAHYRGKRR